MFPVLVLQYFGFGEIVVTKKSLFTRLYNNLLCKCYKVYGSGYCILRYQQTLISLQPRYKHYFVFNYLLILTLHRMKKWLTVILILITAAGMFISCCSFDDCWSDQLATTSNNEKQQPKGNCSPFFACATCPGFVKLSNPIEIVIPIPEKQVHHEQLLKFTLTTYSSPFWQPPRFC